MIKEFTTKELIAILIILILVLLIGINTYNNRNWNKEVMCLTWEQYNNFSCNDIYNCSNIKVNQNAWVQECLCQNSSLTQKVICKEKANIWRYSK